MAENEKMIKVEGKEVAQSDIARALKKLEQEKNQRAKQAERVKNNPELKAKADERARRLRAKNAVLCKKATLAGIVVTDKEIDDYIATSA